MSIWHDIEKVAKEVAHDAEKVLKDTERGPHLIGGPEGKVTPTEIEILENLIKSLLEAIKQYLQNQEKADSAR